jgi:hypothetical protein
MGRPTKVVKKEIRASIRFTRPEYFIVQQKADMAGLTVSEYIRQLAIHAVVKARLTDEQWQDLRRFIGMDNNVNQLTKVAHKEGILPAMVLFQGYRSAFDDFIKKIKS